MSRQLPYKRILLKLSGEALKDPGTDTLIGPVLHRICREIKSLFNLGVSIGIVTGGGNIIRGVQADRIGLTRITADYMGMLATIINGLALQDHLEKIGLKAKLYSAFRIEEIAEGFIKRNVVSDLESGKVVIFTAGTGNPFFSTDTTAALRAIEMNADILLKATDVDGLYDRDPKKDSSATRYEEVSFDEVISRQLGAMDLTAITLCREHGLPVRIFNITREGNIVKAVTGNPGTIIK